MKKLYKIDISKLDKHIEDLIYEVGLDCEIESDGIGAYDYHGQQCVDTGNNYLCIHGMNEEACLSYVLNEYYRDQLEFDEASGITLINVDIDGYVIDLHIDIEFEVTDREILVKVVDIYEIL